MATNDPIAREERFWHCWIFIAGEESKRFLHGYAAPSYTSPPVSPSSQPLDSDSIIEWYSAMNSDQFEVFIRNLKLGCLDASILGVDTPKVEIRFSQTSIQNVLGSTAVPVDSYYSLDNSKYDLTRKSVQRMFGHLHRATNHDAPEQFMHRLGAFDVIHMPLAAEDDEPIVDIRMPVRERSTTRPEKRNQFEIKRRQDIANQPHAGHVRLYCGKTPLLDALYSLQPGCVLFGPITVKDEFDRVQFWMFAEDGSLVHHEDSNWINTVSFQMSVQGHTVKYTDALTEKAKGTGDKDKLRELSHVAVRSTDQPTMIHFATTNLFRQYHREMDERGKALFRSPSSARGFPKGVLGSINAVLHLKALIERQGGKRVWIIDPFFDGNALEMIVPRIGLQHLQMTVITNLSVIDPSTSRRVRNHDPKPVDTLRQRLEKLRNVIHCDLRVLNLLKAEGSAEQIFHDRYLCLETIEGKPNVYLLSNSMNAFTKNYPFCISQLDGDAADEVYKYIIKLSNKIDTETGETLHCDLEWSRHDR